MKRFVNYLPTLLVGLLIAYLSLLREMPMQLPRWDIPYPDKIVHAVLYAVLAAVMTVDMQRGRTKVLLGALLPIVVASLYGGLLEILQEYCFPPRTGEWWDWVADIAGAITGGLVSFLILYRRWKIAKS